MDGVPPARLDYMSEREPKRHWCHISLSPPFSTFLPQACFYTYMSIRISHACTGTREDRPTTSSTLDTYLTDPSLRTLSAGSSPRRQRPQQQQGMRPSSSSSFSPSRGATGSTSSATVSTTSPPASAAPVQQQQQQQQGHGQHDLSPVDVLLGTPPQVVRLISVAAPAIRMTASFLQLVSWQHPASATRSVLVVVVWCGACLFAHSLLSLGAPCFAVALYAISRYLRHAHATSSLRAARRPQPLTPASYADLLQSCDAISRQVTVLNASLVHPLRVALTQPGVARLALTSLPAYLLCVRFLGVRTIIMLAGALVLSWNSPAFRLARRLAWQSAFIRTSTRLICALALGGGYGARAEIERARSGKGLQGALWRLVASFISTSPEHGDMSDLSARGRAQSRAANTAAGESVNERRMRVQQAGAEGIRDVEVQFAIFENQRWWVGLDWTHALLPGERESW